MCGAAARDRFGPATDGAFDVEDEKQAFRQFVGAANDLRRCAARDLQVFVVTVNLRHSDFQRAFGAWPYVVADS